MSLYYASPNSHYEKFSDGTVKCIDDEIPFEIPESWEWCRLSCLTSILGDGIHGTPKYDNAGDIYFVNGNNLNDGIITIKDDTKRVNSTEAAKHKRTLTESTVLVSINGTIGKVAFYNNEKIILGKSACYFNLLGCVNKIYIKCIIETEYFSEYAKKVATGTTIKNVPLAGMRNFLIPLPSSSEQSRIVHRVNELKTKVSQYDYLQSELDILNRTVYEKLKKSVLQEAIQGKLVPQIAEEGDASELLKQIELEKQKLVKEGKLKKKDLVSSTIFRGDDNRYYEKVNGKIECIDEEIPFEIPDSWRWCRIGVVSQSYIGLTYQPSEVNSNGTIVLRSANIQNGKLDLNDIVRVNTLIADKLWVEKNDILICARNGSKKLVGKSAVIEKINEPMTFGAFMAICKTRIYKYVYLFLQSDCFFSQLRGVSGTTTINQLTQNNFNRFLIPIPPLQEQERIVTKLSDLTNRM